MKILITPPDNNTYARYFPSGLIEELKEIGEVERNPFERSFTAEELRERIADADILLTHWGTPRIDEKMLVNAPKLRLVAHAAGSVAGIASDALFERNIPVLSANPVMAQYVAESVLGYMIAGTHRFIQTDSILRGGGWEKLSNQQASLFGAEIGLVGLGAVGRKLLDLLSPFGCKVYVYDPFISADALEKWSFAQPCDFEAAMKKPIVSVHASRTRETYRMINKNALEMMPEGALFINSARASIVDTEALIEKLQEGKLYAVIDVYDEEGAGKPDKRLLEARACTLLQPHAAAITAGSQMTKAIVDDIRRFINGDDLQLAVSYPQFRLMTQE